LPLRKTSTYEGPYKVIGKTPINGEYIIASNYEKGFNAPANYLKRAELSEGQELLNRPVYADYVEDIEAETDETGIDDMRNTSYVPNIEPITDANDASSLVAGRQVRNRKRKIIEEAQHGVTTRKEAAEAKSKTTSSRKRIRLHK